MFTKVFAQILDSSLAEDYRVRLVFEDLLKLADERGIVDITKESISRRTNVPLEIVCLGLAALEQPDPSSRTPDLEGRRITRLDAHRDWGWKIVNFSKYRESATREMLRMSDAQRKAEYRRRKGFSPTPPLLNNKSTEEEAEEETEAEQSIDMSGTCPGLSGTKKRIKDTNSLILLNFLNEKSGRHFRETDTNLNFIIQRLKEPDVDVEGCKLMIFRQVARWKGTPQEEYLRPETLFGKTKFDSYYAARNMPVPHENNGTTHQGNHVKPDHSSGF